MPNYWNPTTTPGGTNPYLDQTSALARGRRDFYKTNSNQFGNIPAVFDNVLRRWVDPKTGNDYSGKITNLQGAVLGYAKAGQWSATDPNPTPAMPEFQRNVLYPETAGPAGDLAKTIGSGTTLTPDYNKLATDYKAALDTQLKTNTANTGALESEVRGSQKTYETNQGDVLTKFGESNAKQAQATKDALARLTAELDKTEANIRNQAGIASATGASIARFGGPGDTATTNNAALAPRITRATLMPQLAAEQNILDRRYGQIANIEMPATQRLYQNDQGLLAFTSALNDKFRGDQFQIASFLNDAKTRLAAMPPAMQESYANYVLHLVGGEQAIAAGQISNLTAVQRLLAASEYLKREVPEPAVQPLYSYPINQPGNNTPGLRQPQQNVTVDDLMRVLARQGGEQGGYQPGQPLTTVQRNAAYATSPQYAGRTVVAPANYGSYPNTSGWGYVNGEYIGSGANDWNEAAYGPVVGP